MIHRRIEDDAKVYLRSSLDHRYLALFQGAVDVPIFDVRYRKPFESH